MRVAIIGLIAVGALLVAVGCGSDSSTMSRAEYDMQLELVCNKGIQDREETRTEIYRELEEREGQANSKWQKESILKLIDLYRDTTDEIADIGLPEESQKVAEEYVRSREEAAAKVQASPLTNHEVDFKKSYELAEKLEAPQTCSNY